MRKIILTKKQLNEVVDIAVNVEKDGDVNSAMSSAKEEADDALGVNTERNYVVNIEESEVLSPDNEKISEIRNAIKLFWSNCDSDINFEEDFIGVNGGFNEAEVMDFIMGNVNFDVSNEDYSLIKSMFGKSIKLRESVVYTFTKKQLNERRLVLESTEASYQGKAVDRAVGSLVSLSSEIDKFNRYLPLANEFYTSEYDWEVIEDELNFYRKNGEGLHYDESEIANAKTRYKTALSNFPIEMQVEFNNIKKNVRDYGSVATDAVVGFDYESDIFPNLIKSLFDGSLSTKLTRMLDNNDEYEL